MVRLIFLTDFTEAYPHHLLRGILQYAREQGHESWVVCRMPPSYKEEYGIRGVLKWAKKWGANAIIGRFNIDEDVLLFQQNKIVVIAQDFKKRFSVIPNITSDYISTGDIAGKYFLDKGFTSFAFYGYKDTVWSDERCEGFRQRIIKAGYEHNFFEYKKQRLENLWFYESTPLVNWLKSLPLHTAVFCCDDNQGNKIAEVCKFSNIRIPNDLAVLGVDNDETLCLLSDPPLSSIRLDIEKGGYEVAQLITQIIQRNDNALKDITIQPGGIINRMSTNVYATDDPAILKAMDYIHNNLSHQINVKDILRQVPLSRRLLEIRFREITGQSIYKYISIRRMELFADLLLERDAPIADIAMEVGFENYGNLSRRFKEVKGCTPMEYRRHNKSGKIYH